MMPIDENQKENKKKKKMPTRVEPLSLLSESVDQNQQI